MGRPTDARSVRASLLLWLLPLVGALIGVGLFVDTREADKRALDAYDLDLMGVMLRVRNALRFTDGVPTILDREQLSRALRNSAGDPVYFRLLGPDRQLIEGEADPFVIGRQTSLQSGIVAALGSHRGEPVRILQVPTRCGERQCAIEVAEPIAARERLRRRTLAATLLPEVILGMAMLAAVWFGVRRALRPLEQVSGEIRARDPSDLDPIQDRLVPTEVRPLIGAINHHLQRAGADARSLREFTANAAHQLRTPIAVLQARIEVAMQKAQQGASAEELRMIHEAALRISRLTSQLLSLARLSEKGTQRERMAPLDLKAEVDTLASEYVHQAIRKNVDLGFELQSARIMGNDWLIREAIGNVVNNAIEYTPRGAEITVRTGVAASAHAFVEVQDNGPGIPRDERARVMERFYRLHGSAGTGSGLGLSIVQAIMRDHGGAVQILDPASGPGCIVRLEFPLIKSP